MKLIYHPIQGSIPSYLNNNGALFVVTDTRAIHHTCHLLGLDIRVSKWLTCDTCHCDALVDVINVLAKVNAWWWEGFVLSNIINYIFYDQTLYYL